FYSSGGMDNRGIRRLRLSERGYTIEEVSDSESQEEKIGAVWYDLTPENVKIAFEASHEWELNNRTPSSSGGAKAAHDMAEEVMGYLKSKDAEALKAMFCDELKASDDFDKKIDEVMNLLDGEIISYRNVSGSGEHGATWDEIKPQLDYVETDTGKCYSLFMSVYIKNQDTSKLGIYQFRFSELGDEDEYGSRIHLNSVTIPREKPLEEYDFD
ncbi:MAG: DUF5104 domain-containing protein, partial [Lachnospiraceae bacterium]|nr:DUF5104 domain-containing protein [Lachnospiraceae bacterium]